MIPISKNINIGKTNKEKFELLKFFATKHGDHFWNIGEDYLELYLYFHPINIGGFSIKDICYEIDNNKFVMFLYSTSNIIDPRSLSITEDSWSLRGEVNTDIDIDGITNNDIEQTKFQAMINYGIDLDNLEFMDKNDFVDRILDMAIEKCKEYLTSSV